MTRLIRHTQAAYKLNSYKEFNPQPPVFAVLTDLIDFYFFSYDGTTFKMDKEIHVSNATRVDYLNGIGNGLLLLLFWSQCHVEPADSRGAFIFYNTRRLSLSPGRRYHEVHMARDHR
jgi:hypothetical protein